MDVADLVPVSRAAQAVLEQLVEGLDRVGDARKVDRGLGFMPVHVEAIWKRPEGTIYSVAHYYLQNGDLVPDPDVTFLRRAEGSFCALTFQNSIAYREPARWEDGVLEVDRAQQRDLSGFCDLWMRNIQEQQALPKGSK